MTEVLSMLAKEDAWKKCTKDSDRVLEIWDDAMRRCLERMNSERGLVIVLNVLLVHPFYETADTD